MSLLAWLKQWKKQWLRQPRAKKIRSRWTLLRLERLEDRLNPTPSIVSISPALGPALGGTSVLIQGSDFTNATEVDFGATSASFSISDDSDIVATSPQGSAGWVDVTVITPDGTSALSADDQFTYVAAPVVSGLSATAGPLSGGTPITISGANFTGATEVDFGTIAVTDLTVGSDNSIMLISPAGISAGLLDVTVLTPGGASAISENDQFTYVAALVVSSIDTTQGSAGGGTLVTITGSDLDNATEVDFGGTPGIIQTSGSSQMTVLSPAGMPGDTVDVTVTTAGGTSVTTARDLFTYEGTPTVTAISPAQGPVAGGTLVTITGTNLDGASVQFGTTAATVQSDTANQITVFSPAGMAGTPVDVTVTTASGISATSPADQFTYIPAPTITGLSPGLGSLAGGALVTITGTGLDNATEVDFGSTPSFDLQSNTSTQITVFSPAGLTAGSTVAVTVITAGGASAVSGADQFTYEGLPTITSISPATGSAAGGTLVTITGTNLDDASVQFGTTAAVVESNTTTQITALSPAGTPLAGVDVTVTTASGTSVTLPADLFTYEGLPTITSISPATGSAGGGTLVTITGTNLDNATEVDFGADNPANSILTDTPTQITVYSPSGTPGATVDVRVSIGALTTAVTAADKFTYAGLPTVTSVSPAKGPTDGGATVTITGTNLEDAQEVDFGTTTIDGFSYGNAATIVSNTPTQIVVTAPSGALGTVDVTVTTASGVSATSSNDRYTYAVLPIIESLSSTSGPLAGGTSVAIFGSNLDGVSAVHFGAQLALNVFSPFPGEVLATSPAGVQGTVDVTVTTPQGTSALMPADQFTYTAIPFVTQISPSAGPPGGGSTVTITGSQLGNATAVSFGSAAATIVSDSATQLVVTSPAGQAGTVEVTVTTANGVSDLSPADQYTYEPAPTFTSLSPATGTTAGGTLVAIIGTNLAGVTAVQFGTQPASNFFAVSATEVDAYSPAGSAGPVDVTVTTPSGTTALAPADRFTYVVLPNVTSLSTPAGPVAGGTLVTIKGSNLDGATAVAFGTAAATLLSVSSNQLVVLSPVAPLGTVDVTVKSSQGVSATSSSDQFTYEGAPTITSISPATSGANGFTPIIITGTNLTGVTAVQFGATPATIFSNISSTEISAYSPAGTGTVDVKVTTPIGASALTAADRLTYVPAPVITGLSQSSGPAGGGTTVTITGTGFANAEAVDFGALAATILSHSATQIVVVSPASTLGLVNVTVLTPLAGTAITPADQFTYVAGVTPPPVITNISPNVGPVAGGTTVTITGTNLANASSVRFGSFPGSPSATIVSDTATQIVVASPQGSSFSTQAPVYVTVTTPGGVSAPTPADQFQYVTPPASVVFVTGAQTLLAGQPSGALQIQLQDAQGNPAEAGLGGVTFSLGTSSSGGAFLNVNGTPLAGASLTIPAGASSASFAYSDTSVGTPTLVLTSANFPALTQQETVDALASALHVSNTQDAGLGSLRQAITDANAAPGSTIVFDAGVTGTIQLQSPLPALSANMNLVGPGANLLTIQSDGSNPTPQDGTDYRITSGYQGGGNETSLQYEVQNLSQTQTISISITFSWVVTPPVGSPITVTDPETYVVAPGQTVDADRIINPSFPKATVTSASFAAPHGSAVRGTSVFSAQATVTLSGVTVTNAGSTGIVNYGNLTLNGVAVLNSHASGLSHLPPYGEPGGILNLGALTVLNSTIAGNTTANSLVAAGIDSEAGSVTIINSTISDNTANHTNSAGGIGIYGGSLYIANSTVTGNVANDSNTSGGGIDSSGNVTIFDTLVAGNTGATQNPGDVHGAFLSLGHNLIGSAGPLAQGFGANGDQVGTLGSPLNAKLDPNLKNNGGPTPTHALLAGSPAIDAGDNTNAPATDQRGLTRIAGNAIDIGAFEFHPPPLIVTSAPQTTFTVGQPNLFTVATTPNPSGVFAALSVSGKVPAGVAFTDNGDGTATLSGMANPSAPATGVFSFTINGALEDSVVFSQTFNLTLIDPASITSVNHATFLVGHAGSFSITATPGLPTATTLTLMKGSILPTGVTLGTTVNGVAKLSGTPAANTGGTYTFTVIASNGSASTTQSFTLTVTQPSSISSAAAATFTAGRFGSFTVTTKGTPTATLTAVLPLNVSWPTGISFVDNGNGTATLSGTPTVGLATPFSFTINAGNGVGTAMNQLFKLSIVSAPTITSANTATFTVGKAGSLNITATPGLPTATTLTLMKGSILPTGVTLGTTVNGVAKLSGTPAANTGGVYSFTIIASNGSASTAQSFTLTVTQPSSISSAAAATFTAGRFGSFTVTTKGTPTAMLTAVLPLNVSWPDGISFVDNGNGTATLSGTPSASLATPFSFTINASNGVGTAMNQLFKLSIVSAPTITSANTATFTVGKAGSLNITATPGLPTATTLTLMKGSILPTGVTLGTTVNGVAKLSGTPAANTGGVYSFTIIASNGSASTAQSFTLTVTQPSSISSAAAATFTAGRFGSFTVTTKGTPTATLTATLPPSVSWPTGISFVDNGNGTATLSGTPTAGLATPFSFTINAGNGVGTAMSQLFKLSIVSAPTITSANMTTFTVGKAGSFSITATPGLPTATTLTLMKGSILPTGVTLGATVNGVAKLSGTPAANTGGTYTFTVIASNGSASTTQPFTLTVTQPSSISSAAAATFTVGQPGSFTVTTKGTPTATLTATLPLNASWPNGISFVDNGNGTATLSGTPSTSLATPFSFTINASNNIGTAVSQLFKLSIVQAPTITSANHAAFTVGQAGGSFSFTAPTATSISFQNGKPPLGLTLGTTANGVAKLSGTPAANTAGVYTFTVVARNSLASSTQTFTLTINQAPSITSAAAATFTVGQPGSFTITTKAGFPAATTLTANGTLPSGLSFTDNGNGTATLSGTPQPGTGGSVNLTITAGNGAVSVMQTLKLTVNQPPAITSAALTTFTAGQANSFQITTTGFPVAVISFSGTPPAGVSLVANKSNGTAVLSGTPTVPGTYTFVITASNGILANLVQTFTLTVNPKG